MDLELIIDFCESFDNVTSETPFGPQVLVFKVKNKIFALLPIDGSRFTINLKNHPEKNIQLREEFSGITPGFHMNKKHWNTLAINELKLKLVTDLIAESYAIVSGSKK
jgi:predicted DNA-binding protein (MmcQ/YjbR family)